MEFSIGLSGLKVSQAAIDLIGTNIANATTEGYHRQSLIVKPVSFSATGNASVGGGADIADVQRDADQLLENELLRQQPQMSQNSQELDSLQEVENFIGDINSSNLGTSLQSFFDSMRQLAGQPDSQPLQEQAIWGASGLASRFRQFGQFLVDLKTQISQDAGRLSEQINGLAQTIAKLNEQVCATASRGGNANLLIDQRDQAISNLSQIVQVQTSNQPGLDGAVNVSVWGNPLVTGFTASALDVGLGVGGKLGVTVAGASYFQTDVQGGTLGGLVSLHNDVIANIQGQLDQLASAVIDQVNRIHVQGVGADGAFTQLDGAAVGDKKLSDLDAGITAGQFVIRLTNTATGTTTRQVIAIDPAVDTLSTVAAKIDAVNGLSASVANQALHIQADGGYTFDFRPATVLDTSGLTGTAVVSDAADPGAGGADLTCTIQGSGQVGVDSNLSIQVTSGGQVVKTLNIGQGYRAGDDLDLGGGLHISLSAGSVVDKQVFTLSAPANSDPTGFLAAAGINTLFVGHSAITMDVSDAVMNDPGRLATSAGLEGNDNANVLALAGLGDGSISSLGGTSPKDFYRTLVTGVGQQVKLRQDRQSGLQSVVQQLNNQRDKISGVDINQEAASLLIYQQSFQAAAKLISIQTKALETLMDLLQ